MDFHTDKPIYQQIIDYAYARILAGEWAVDERIPSVRELATAMAVNTHTVLKAYDFLQLRDIIAPRRGMGYYLSHDAPAKVIAERRQEFLQITAPRFLQDMQLLGLSIEDVLQACGR